MQKLVLKNLDCANCALKIENKLQNTQGVSFASVNFATSTLTIEAENFDIVKNAISEIEPDVEISNDSRLDLLVLDRKTKLTLVRMALALVLFVIGLTFHATLHNTPYQIAEFAVMVPAYLLSGYPVLLGAFRNIQRKQIFDEHFLMTIATLGAWAIHEVPEAVGVMIFYMIGEFLQELSVARSRRSIRSLLAIQPDQANLLKNGDIVVVPVNEVMIGDEIIVRPGERVPLDGVIIKGESLIDTSALTGEHVPRQYTSDQEVLAGMVNQTELLRIRVIHGEKDSSIARILDLVENASSKKAPTEKFISQFARYYTPFIVIIALGIAIIPPLISTTASFSDWIYRALVVLVISCPCALVISIPLGYFGGVGAASKRGILVKGSNYLDVLAAAKTVVFDKTGTLTQGVFEVSEITPADNYSKTELINIAQFAETHSNHPIARSIRKSGGEHQLLSPEDLEQFSEFAGQGVALKVNGDTYLAGNDSFMHSKHIPHDQCEIPGTIVHLAKNGNYAGYLRIDDKLKEDAPSTVKELRKMGIKHLIMLSGDHKEKAEYIAKNLGFDEFQGELQPEDKVSALETILNEQESRDKVAYVGDGINDAPVIARADVGIAMGALGSQAAIESADVVIMSDATSKIPEAIRVGRRTKSIVWQNIVLALSVKAIFIILGISGEASMWEAVFADMGVALLAILNAVRIIR